MQTHTANEIWETVKHSKPAFVSIGVFSAVINLLMLVPAIYMLQVYDRVLISQNETTLLMLTLIILGLFLLMALIEYLRGMVAIRVGAHFDMALNSRVYTAAFQANLKQGGAFNATQALQDLTTLRQFMTGASLFAFFDAPWFPIYLAVIFLFDPLLGWFALGGTLVLVGLALLNQWRSAKPLQSAEALSIQSGQLAGSTLRNAEAIEAMGMLPALRQRWFKKHEQFLDQQRIASETSSAITASTKGVRIALQSLVLGLAALLVLENQISAGMMIAASILMGRTLAPIEGLINTWRQWSHTRQAYDRLTKLLMAFPPNKKQLSLPKPSGRLSVENVSARLPNTQKNVLSNVSCQLKPGEVLGLIGSSGSGKTTLARLMVGIWPAASGKVRLDSADIFRWNKESLGQHIGYLPQDVELFAGTISENIARFGEMEAEKVIKSAQLAGVHEMILQFPQGYDTALGENGAGLSGGQKQRIGLARALYGSPVLVVLDEPNSNLDDAGEAALLKAIQTLKEAHCAVVLITHRQAILQVTTHLLVLKSGRVALHGEREEILTKFSQKAKTTASQTPSYSFGSNYSGA